MSSPAKFIRTTARDEHITKLLNDLFEDAAPKGVSDVHFEDGEQETRIRYRINGDLHTVLTIPRAYSVECMNKIRGRASLPISEHRRPVDGRFSFTAPELDIAIDVRVSFKPIIHGTSMVCRILDQKNTARTIEQLEMPGEVRRWIHILLKEPHGLFIVTGPTGSGKTSTLYALLNALHSDSRKIVTIEDPVEYRVPGLCQTNIEGSLTFAEALRAELRQDPDIILVGEIRDAETANIAVQAAMTGHLVLSTLHANDSAATVARMLDLGVDPNTLGAALRGVLAQRLVRRLDTAHNWAKPTEIEAEWLANHQIAEIACDYGVPQRDKEDGRDGYRGRLAVMELLVVDRTMRNVLPARDAKLISAVAKNQPQFQTLAQCAASLSRQGLTSIDQLFTVSSVSEHLQTLRTLQERLIELGHLTPYQFDVCKELQTEASRRGEKLPLEDVLIRQRFCTQAVIDEVRAL